MAGGYYSTSSPSQPEPRPTQRNTGPKTDDLAPDPEVIRRFSEYWFEPCKRGYVEIGWTDAATGELNHFRRFALSGGVEVVVQFVCDTNRVPGQSVYYRCATVSTANGKNTKDENFVEAPGIWCDLDTEEQLDQACKFSPLFPSCRIVTGLHPHAREQWLFRADEPATDPEVVRDLNKRLQQLFGSDKTVVNPSRLMRLPGTIAWPWKEGRIAELTEMHLATDPRDLNVPWHELDEQLPRVERQPPPREEVRERPHQAQARADIPVGCTAYGWEGLQIRCAEIRASIKGKKHDTIVAASKRAGELVRAKQLDEAVAKAELHAAVDDIAHLCKSVTAAHRTVDECFASGMQSDWQKPNGSARTYTNGHDRAAKANGHDTNGDATHGANEAAGDDAAGAAEIARLAKLSGLQYGQCRKAAAEQLGIPVKLLDDLVRAAQKAAHGANSHQGRPLAITDPEPWSHPVDIGDVLDELREAIHRHVIMSDDGAVGTALWIAHTYIFMQFHHTPRLGITSPTKRCGKSTVMRLLASTCHRALKADNISPSGVYRVVEALTPPGVTLLLDEVDTFATENEQLRGVLNSGFEVTGSVVRIEERNGQHEPVEFHTFAPLALAAIKAIPDTLADRAVPIRLARKTAADKVVKFREEGAIDRLHGIRRKLIRWAADAGSRLQLNPTVPSAFSDRQGDICIPLLAIADQAGGEWPKRARTALPRLFGLFEASDEGNERSVMLLSDIRDCFNAGRNADAAALASETIVNWLIELEGRPWIEAGAGGRALSKQKLAALLAPFGVKPDTHRLTIDGKKTTLKGYLYADFKDVWNRYLTPESHDHDDHDDGRTHTNGHGHGQDDDKE
jgi:putative DNA primase/helicase